VSNCNAAGANVVNMSLGGGFSQILQDAITSLENTNDRILFVAAAGNGGDSSYLYPASIDSPIMMSVACVDSSKARCSFSQYNDQVDIAAPGLYVRSTVPGYGTYGYKSGTSMSSPHVAAVAALVWSHSPEKSAFEIRQALEQSAIQPNGSQQGIKNDEFGWGIVNAKKALELLDGGTFTRRPSISPSPTPSPTKSMQPSGPCMPIKIEILPDSWPEEISWELKDPQGNEMTSNQEHDTLRQGVLFEHEMCVGSFCDDSMNYQFTINDNHGDGLTYDVNAYFAIYVYSTRIFGQSDGTDYGSGDQVLIDACRDFSAAPTTLVPTSMPSPLPSKSMQPSGPCMPIKIEIIPDKYAKDISWELKDPRGNEMTSNQEHGTLTRGVLFVHEMCVGSFCGNSMNYVFNINDSYGDGLKVGVEDAHFAIYVYSTRIFGQSDGTDYESGDQVVIDACSTNLSSTPSYSPSTEPTIIPTYSPTYYDERRCTESEEDEWYLRSQDTKSSLGVVDVLRSCKWLANHKLKSKLCAKEDSSPTGHRPAKDVCRVTCATCDPDPDRCPERNNQLESTIEQHLNFIAKQKSQIAAYEKLLADNGIEF